MKIVHECCLIEVSERGSYADPGAGQAHCLFLHIPENVNVTHRKPTTIKMRLLSDKREEMEHQF